MTDLDDHINAVLGDHDGLLLHWTVTASLASPDESTTIITVTDERMDMVTQLGLAESSRIVARRRLAGEFDDDLDEASEDA